MRRRRRKTQIDGAFSWRLIEMLESPVLQVLNQSEHRVLMRLEIELGHHGGTENGRLIVTFKSFALFGVDRQAIAPSLRVLTTLGIVKKTKQGAGGRTEYHDASEYGLTYRHTDTENPTNEWRAVKSLDEAKRLATVARKAKERDAVERSLKSYKKLSSGVEKPQSPGWKNHPGKSKVPGGKSNPSRPGGDLHPSIYISGRDTEQTPREARPLQGAVASGAAAPSTTLAGRGDILQASVAVRLGRDGWPILQQLEPEHLQHLLALQDRGDLGEEVLVNLRRDHRRTETAA
jgi:hypothetical protein